MHRIYLSCLKSPIAAREMYLEIKKRVLGLAEFPQAAISYASPVSGNKRYKLLIKIMTFIMWLTISTLGH